MGIDITASFDDLEEQIHLGKRKKSSKMEEYLLFRISIRHNSPYYIVKRREGEEN